MATHTPVSALMARDPEVAAPDDSVEQLVARFLARGLHGLPIVDGDRQVVGFVTARDLVRHHYERGDTDEDGAPLPRELASGFHVHHASRACARDVMTPAAVTLDETTPISKAAALMAFEHVHRAPVLSRSGALVGVLSALDILRWLAIADEYRFTVDA
jgi:CBS domain-containing protein